MKHILASLAAGAALVVAMCLPAIAYQIEAESISTDGNWVLKTPNCSFLGHARGTMRIVQYAGGVYREKLSPIR